MKPTTQNRRGFTLIEMLVVVFIIVVLMGLLLPAVQSARESARATQCMNNQQELAKAIIQYDFAKKRLPGVMSYYDPTNQNTAVTWVISIFSDLGRTDLWDYWQAGINVNDVSGNPKVAGKVAQLICPSNPTIQPEGGLSYVVNLGVYLPPVSSKPVYDQRLFRNYAAWDTASTPEPDQTITAVKTLTRTVMLSERLEAGPWNYVPATFPAPGDYAGLGPLAFFWPIYDSTKPIPPINTILSSNHRRMIIVTFFDGHSEQIPDTTQCWMDPDNQVIGIP